MKKTALSIVLLLALGVVAGFQNRENKMLEIKFSLGKNIVDTAKASGIPEFGAGNVDDLIEYAARPLPTDVPVIYGKPGYEIRVIPAFSLVLSADRRRTPNDIVYGARVRIANAHLKSHDAGQSFVENLIVQFNNGKWKRHISPSCPAVTGLSSLLNIAGELDSACSLDPHYKLKQDEWIKVFGDSQSYEWLGDGVFARLTVGYDNDIRGITYNILIEFEDYNTMLAVRSENEIRENKEGDAKGWNTSANAEQDLKTTAERVKILEENAIKRGDTVIPR